MNKLLIGLLIVAATAGAFFVLRKKNNSSTSIKINKEWIIGKWKEEPGKPATDSAQTNYRYDFQKDGLVLRSISDSVKADTSHYEWSKSNELVWKESVGDSTGKNFTVIKLTLDSLQLQSKEKDSIEVLFIKVK
jgi:hypothetical protein